MTITGSTQMSTFVAIEVCGLITRTKEYADPSTSIVLTGIDDVHLCHLEMVRNTFSRSNASTSRSIDPTS